LSVVLFCLLFIDAFIVAPYARPYISGQNTIKKSNSWRQKSMKPTGILTRLSVSLRADYGLATSSAEFTGKPLAILVASSYGGPENRVRGAITFSRHLAMTTEGLGSRVLLVDDLVESGISLRESINWLQHHYGDDIEEIRTGVLWYKDCSVITPDYYVDYLPDNPWIHQPFERYERMNPSDLAGTYLVGEV
jgi:hypothetical protein